MVIFEFYGFCLPSFRTKLHHKWYGRASQPSHIYFSFIINMMRYTEKVYSSSIKLTCASLRKIPLYLEGQAAERCCRLFLFINRIFNSLGFRSAVRSALQPSFSRSAFRSAVQPFVQPDFLSAFVQPDFLDKPSEQVRNLIRLPWVSGFPNPPPRILANDSRITNPYIRSGRIRKSARTGV